MEQFKMKICSECGGSGTFYKDRFRKDGLSYLCKDCKNSRSRTLYLIESPKKKIRRNLIRIKNKNSLKSRSGSMWRSLLRRVRNGQVDERYRCYKHVKLSMTREEFVSWAIPELEKYFIKFGKPKTLKETPTVDRIKNEGHYELGNLQIVNWFDNIRRRRNTPNVNAPVNKAWCCMCKDYLDVNQFCYDRSTVNKLAARCKYHDKIRKLNKT